MLYTRPAMAEAAVAGVPDEPLGQEVKVFVALRPGRQAAEPGVIEYVDGKILERELTA